MNRDEQHFLDFLSTISSDIARYTEEVCDFIDSTFERSTLPVREAIYDAQWWPEALRPPPPPSRVMAKQSLLQPGVWGWVRRNRTLSITAAAFAVSGTCTYLYMLWDRRRRHYARKRRARRTAGGAKLDVVVVAGALNVPLSRSVILDLERRGFIVYVLVGDARDEEVVKAEGKADVLPLLLDVTSPASARTTIQNFAQLLEKPQSFVASGPPRSLNLTGLVLIPDTFYPFGPIEVLDPEAWYDAVNTKFLHAVAATQVFLPLVRAYQSRILLLTPSITASLQPAFHSIETATFAALESYVSTLGAELRPTGARVSHLKLGAVDLGAASTPGQQPLQQTRAGQVMGWTPGVRGAYGRSFVDGRNEHAVETAVMERTARASPARELHNAVFDALMDARQRHRPVWHIGRGSRLYDVVGRWSPPGLVAWMMSRRAGSATESYGNAEMILLKGTSSSSSSSAESTSGTSAASAASDASDAVDAASASVKAAGESAQWERVERNA